MKRSGFIKRRVGLRRTRKHKSRRSELQAEITRLHSLYICNRDGRKCVICGSTSVPQCGHVFPGRWHSTLWDVGPDGNAHCQCRTCNFVHTRNQAPYFAWYIKKFGLEAWEAMRLRHNTRKDWSIGDLEALHAWLKERVNAT